MNKEFIQAIEDLEKEKHISKEILLEAIESALVSAYKKNYGTSQNVRVDINQDTGDINVYMRMDVVDDDDFEDDLTQITLEEAMEIDPRYEVGDVRLLRGISAESRRRLPSRLSFRESEKRSPG